MNILPLFCDSDEPCLPLEPLWNERLRHARARLLATGGLTPRWQFYTLTRRRPLTSTESIAALGDVAGA